METNNLPPFYVGQRVVCIDDIPGRFGFTQPPIKKGNVYTVLGLDKKCCNWIVDVGLTGPTVLANCTCGSIYYTINSNFWVRASRLAPIKEQFQSISYTKILEEENKLISIN